METMNMQVPQTSQLCKNGRVQYVVNIQKRRIVRMASTEPQMQSLDVKQSPIKNQEVQKGRSNTSFFDIMKFNGIAPEVINGRLAMLGIVSAAIHEFQTGQTIIQQVQNASVLEWLWYVLWIYASLIPMIKGARMEAFGKFTPRAEITNGRAAMLGFGVLLFLEIQTGMCFF
eukprot:TRINITY_DN26544_c0_g1_i3.p1 TRINITY_DN26544_c0_g1~~TRINITY_DN26544_c0_g1_i3.p1  ORF type:complete len:172 (-),score=16.64 TRINITY_DN26544_c0_g1_i3:136-651(-)